MNNYNNTNNYLRAPVGDASLRFNNWSRPRYGTINIPRYSYNSPHPYQYQQNKNNQTDPYHPNQHDKSIRNYGHGLQKISNQNQNNQQQSIKPPLHILEPTALPSLSKSLSSFPAVAPNSLNLSSAQTTTSQTHASMNIAQPNPQRHQQLRQDVSDPPNYYNFGYNSYSSYNANSIVRATTSAHNLSDFISPFMWQTIKSTPPPNMLQQQPPLPQQNPPTLPPLPSADQIKILQPPRQPLMPSTSSTNLDYGYNTSNVQEKVQKTVVKMKAKRKAMSTRYRSIKTWSDEDVILALKAEEENVKKLKKDVILILRFPDPEISRESIKCYSPDIESVHFQLNFAPRYCLLYLKPGTNVEKTIETLSKIPFGTGYLSVEIKQIPSRTHSTKLCDVDPYTLYVGNLPTTIACKTLKDNFPGAARIDIGFAQRMKYTRYAFIRYSNVHQAIEAYKRTLDIEIGGRSLTIRFRRIACSNEGNKSGEPEVPYDVQEDLISQGAIPSDDNLTQLSQNDGEHLENVEGENLEKENAEEENVGEKNVEKELLEGEHLEDNCEGGQLDEQYSTRENVNEKSLEKERFAKEISIRENGKKLENENFRKENQNGAGNLNGLLNEYEKNTIDYVTNSDSIIQPITDEIDGYECCSKDSTTVRENNLSEKSFSPEDNVTETNDDTPSSISSTTATTTQEIFNSSLHSIKPDPDIDPEDVVVRNDTIKTRFDSLKDRIKQENELGTEFEFFASTNKLNKNSRENMEKSSGNNTVPLLSTTNKADATCTLSTNSLGEFLQVCQSPQESNDIDDIIGPPPTKRNRPGFGVLEKHIKKEPFIISNRISTVDVQLLAKKPTFTKSLKAEPDEDCEHLFNESVGTSCNVDILPEDNLLQSILLDVKKPVPDRRKTIDLQNSNDLLTNDSPNGQKASNSCQNDTILNFENELSLFNNDVVSSNALFLRKNLTSNIKNACDNEEFFETRIKLASKKSSCTASVKEGSLNKSTKGIPKESTCKKDNINKNTKIHENSRRSYKNCTHLSDALKEKQFCADEEDLVPEQNILSSRQSSQIEGLNRNNYISPNKRILDLKWGAENDDLFLTPLKKYYKPTNVNKANEFAKSSTQNLKSQSNSNIIAAETSEANEQSGGKKGDNNSDDDIVIISENISPKQRTPNANALSLSNSFASGQTDLLNFKKKSNGVGTLLLHHDNLDKLFEQLDSDSDIGL